MADTNTESVTEITIESSQPFTNTLHDDPPPYKLPKQASTTTAPSAFNVTTEELLDIIGDRNPQGVIARAEAAGGVKLLAEQLYTDITQGISASDNHAIRAQVYGDNVLPKGKERTIFRILLEAASDK